MSRCPLARRPPAFFVVLVASCIVTMISMGLRSSMGVSLDPVTESLGIGTSTFGLLVAIHGLMWGPGQALAGAVLRLFIEEKPAPDRTGTSIVAAWEA